MLKLLKFDGHLLIAEVEEIPGVEFGDPDCILKNSYEIIPDEVETLPNPIITKFPSFSRESELIVRSSDITFITEPDDLIISRYYETKADTE
jgi:hypothetical protein